MRAPRAAAGLLLCLALIGCSQEPVDDPTVQRPASPAQPDSTAPAGPSPARTAGITLTGNGIDLPDRLLEFGTPVAQALPVLVGALGEPTEDTGVTSSFSAYGTCPGDRLRALEFHGGALYVLFGDVEGSELTMYQWTLADEGRRSQAPEASAFVGDVTTHEFAVGDTLASLREGVEGAELEVVEANEPFPPAFRLTDQSPGLFGTLTGTADSDTITSVVGGEGCGE